ncbi:hypothetical protein E2C01_012856 [Portunus trituberculatus]|uniref:Uncharacterized protein n=1 Tax=Portunus trituberculatus TaxID=210409 RepID=A0A5B7DF49_PORTR|nr:hypothetical protein [Portunus trituberculatus]
MSEYYSKEPQHKLHAQSKTKGEYFSVWRQTLLNLLWRSPGQDPNNAMVTTTTACHTATHRHTPLPILPGTGEHFGH